MKSFKIAVVQHSSPVGDKAGNLQQTIDWTKKAKKAGANLVCFPELSITGHAGAPEMVKEAEPIPHGDSIRKLMTLAAELDIYISAGIVEQDGSNFHNTQFIIGPDGFKGKQRKIHLSGDENDYFKEGSDYTIFELPFAKVGIVICYDNQFPEVTRCLAVKGAEVLLAPHAARFGNWIEDAKGREIEIQNSKRIWKTVHCCRSLENGCFSAFCNTAGRSALSIKGVEANHVGGLLIVDPRGNVIAESKSTDIADEMVTAELDAKIIADVRKNPNFNLWTRKPQMFKPLCEPKA